MTSHRALAIALAASLAGCADLLPKSETAIRSPWHSFAEAKTAIESIEPQRTRAADLKAIGIDPFTSPNVQLLSYSDIALRFPLHIAAENLDRGLRECLESGKACTGYYINVKEVKRDRVGGFWEDALGFKRTVQTTGWTFNALVLMVEDRVVYTLYGGQPNLSEREVDRQPLGPAQNLGDAVPMPR